MAARGFEAVGFVRRRVVFVAAAVDAVRVERDDVATFARPPVAGFGVAVGFAEPEVVAGGFDPEAVVLDAVLGVLRVLGGVAFAAAADGLATEAAGFAVDRRFAGFVARLAGFVVARFVGVAGLAVVAAFAVVAALDVAAGFAVVAAFAVVAGLAVVEVLVRLREPGGRPRRRGAAVASGAAGLRCRIGVTTWLACTAAEPTVRAAPPTAPPTASAAVDAADTALDAAEAASEATFDASPATSDSDSATCLRRFATSFRPLLATAVASCRTRLLSVLRAAASCFSSLRSSLPALLDSGVTTPLASTMTSATVSTTTSRRPLLPPSAPFAIDRPPALPRSASAPRGRCRPTDRSGCDRAQVCHAPQRCRAARTKRESGGMPDSRSAATALR